jgi:hypothetical protein
MSAETFDVQPAAAIRTRCRDATESVLPRAAVGAIAIGCIQRAEAGRAESEQAAQEPSAKVAMCQSGQAGWERHSARSCRREEAG